MNEEVKEAIEEFKREYNDGRILKSDIIIELSTARIINDLIDKLQKENKELKEENSHQWKERCRLTFELERLKEENQKLKECHFKYEEMTGIDLLLGE